MRLSFSSTVSTWLKLTIQEKVQKNILTHGNLYKLRCCLRVVATNSEPIEFQSVVQQGADIYTNKAIDSTVCMEQVLQTLCIIQIPTNLLTLSYTNIDKTTHIHGFIGNHSLTGESFGHASPIPTTTCRPVFTGTRRGPGSRGDSKLFQEVWRGWSCDNVETETSYKTFAIFDGVLYLECI